VGRKKRDKKKRPKRSILKPSARLRREGTPGGARARPGFMTAGTRGARAPSGEGGGAWPRGGGRRRAPPLGPGPPGRGRAGVPPGRGGWGAGRGGERGGEPHSPTVPSAPKFFLNRANWGNKIGKKKGLPRPVLRYSWVCLPENPENRPGVRTPHQKQIPGPGGVPQCGFETAACWKLAKGPGFAKPSIAPELPQAATAFLKKEETAAPGSITAAGTRREQLARSVSPPPPSGSLSSARRGSSAPLERGPYRRLIPCSHPGHIKIQSSRTGPMGKHPEKKEAAAVCSLQNRPRSWRTVPPPPAGPLAPSR